MLKKTALFSHDGFPYSQPDRKMSTFFDDFPKGRILLPNQMNFWTSAKGGEGGGGYFNLKICTADFGNFKQGFLSIYTPLSVEICFLLITHNFSKFWKKIPKSRIFFQNFQSHKGAANDIKGAAASLLVNSKIFIFNLELQ